MRGGGRASAAAASAARCSRRLRFVVFLLTSIPQGFVSTLAETGWAGKPASGLGRIANMAVLRSCFIYPSETSQHYLVASIARPTATSGSAGPRKLTGEYFPPRPGRRSDAADRRPGRRVEVQITVSIITINIYISSCCVRRLGRFLGVRPGSIGAAIAARDRPVQLTFRRWRREFPGIFQRAGRRGYASP